MDAVRKMRGMSDVIAELAAEVAGLRAEVQALRREFTVERISWSIMRSLIITPATS
jgi:HJR/Mrr/RecB family endonuclease